MKQVKQVNSISIREDLQHRDYAISLGWEVVYSAKDKYYKRTGLNRDNCPHDGLKFRKNDIILACVYPGWKEWRLVDGLYQQAKTYSDLKTALETAGGK